MYNCLECIESFSDFLEFVRINIPDYLIGYDIEDIKIEDIRKNNGTLFTSLIIVIKDENITPNIYMEYYYNLFENGECIDDILKEIAGEFVKARNRISNEICEVNLECFNKDNVFIKLINAKRNEELLKSCPHIIFCDLAVTFRILFQSNEDGISSALLSNEEFNKWNMSVEELFETSKSNMKNFFPPVLMRLDELLRNRFPEYKDVPEYTPLYVLTNNCTINGASYMVYEDLLRDFASEHGSFYVIPSSIHELILLPGEDDYNVNDLIETVREVNEFAVSKLEYLSDNVYFYDANTNSLKAGRDS